jgi:hypothetical protein
MKFSPNHPAGSLNHLTERAKIVAAGCPRCHCATALGPHGHLRGNSPTDGSQVNRGLRFFCSNRYSNPGCGGTFSVHWDTGIPSCSLRTSQLLELLRAVSTSPSIHRAWWSLKLPMSLGSAYRWMARWRRGTAAIRTRLGQVTPPPGRTDGLPDPLTLRHLAAAFAVAACRIAAFQGHLQVPISG